jgi:DNA processing protein
MTNSPTTNGALWNDGGQPRFQEPFRVMDEARDLAALRALLTLRVIPGLGDVARRKLLVRHRTPRAALRGALTDRTDFERTRYSQEAQACLEATLNAGASVLAYRAPGYPPSLRQLHAAPTLLWVRGDTGLLERPAVAIVGTRRNTEYGAETARMLASDLARAGIVIVSGLAHGIDRYAHEGALDVGGSTIAVVGSGIDIHYPRRHAQLQERIARDGLLISEFKPGEPALRHHFPRRNRLIAALSLGVVVVEAPERSGALNTTRHAIELNRDVFAVPGPIGRETSMGTNALIRDGAGLVMDAADVMEALRLVPVDGTADSSAGRATADSPVATMPVVPEDPILALLDAEPRHADEIAERCGIPIHEAVSRLLCLEIEGLARQVPGLRFARPRQAA